MLIRAFGLADFEACQRLWAEADGLGSVPREEIELKVERDPELFLVAEDAGQVVGVVMGSYDGRRGWIFRLAVAADRRREGIGQALVDEVEGRMAAMGVPQVNLLVLKSNTGGHAFWEAAGYPGYEGVYLHSKRLDGTPMPTDGAPPIAETSC